MDSGRLEAVPNGAVHLDTVRALHQTVVSLRTALEVSKNELRELKEKYEEHSRCNEFADVIEKLTIENHILRRKIIDSGQDERDPNAQNIKLEVTYSPLQNVDDYSGSEVVIKTATSELNTTADTLEPDHTELEEGDGYCSADKLNEPQEVKFDIPEEVEIVSGASSPHNLPEETDIEKQEPTDLESPVEEQNTVTELTESHFASLPKESEETSHPNFKTKLELLSKFDVRIKVRTLKEGAVFSSSTSDSDSTSGGDKKQEKERTDSRTSFQFEERKEHFENAEDPKGNKISVRTVATENVKMAVPSEADAKTKVDKFDVQVRITSEENLVVKENVERSRRKDTLNLDVDDLSLRSLSEGDNSVFSEGGTTPLEPAGAGADDKEQESASGNESEEVDDIELIFTTDESKDMSNLQEDLVSIRETDQWGPPSSASTHSTPVLIKFHTLDPDFQPGGDTKDIADTENQENSGLQGVIAESSLRNKRVSLPSDKEIRHVAFNGKGSLDLPGRGILKSYENKSDNMLYKKSPNTSTRRLDSVDSLTCEYNRGLSFDNTKSSSFEIGSSMDILHREESVDSFYRTGNLGHRFSVFAETDISKCGISEDDLAGNLNMRRNTCPNPFQYRPGGYRTPSRTSGPLKAGNVCRHVRPVLREAALHRRSSAAQTDVCALPNRWSSDGYLAHKMSVVPSGMPTLPQRAPVTPAGGAGGRRLTVPNARPPPQARGDDSRRVLLSDIGFTSMVPELSRSADPVWALGKRIAESPASTSTSKFLSRGSSYRSPCLSIDRSNDWIPQTVYVPSARLYPECRAWRSSLPDVRRDDTEGLLHEADVYLRRSTDNLRYTSLDCNVGSLGGGRPYIPREPKQLRLGHMVKVIAPHGRLVIGRVRYVGLAGGTAATSSVVVGAEFPCSATSMLARNDGTHRGRRYFLTPPGHGALFVPFSKVVMAWAN
ncbi:hypothetical protein ABMA27_004801 [Loxostege sticticalis]|uniref:CAP-Gly domain-containing protein n=1 Tax=Loxostege sticticalis TaxID=481309 RepID=A0ABR3HKQ2_LOXSC